MSVINCRAMKSHQTIPDLHRLAKFGKFGVIQLVQRPTIWNVCACPSRILQNARSNQFATGFARHDFCEQTHSLLVYSIRLSQTQH